MYDDDENLISFVVPSDKSIHDCINEEKGRRRSVTVDYGA